MFFSDNSCGHRTDRYCRLHIRYVGSEISHVKQSQGHTDACLAVCVLMAAAMIGHMEVSAKTKPWELSTRGAGLSANSETEV